MNKLTMSLARQEDLPFILELYKKSFPGEEDDILSEQDSRELFQRFSNYPNYKVYLARYNNEAVGTFALLIMDNLGHMGAPSGIVEDVAVSPDYQNMGIGKQMMQFAMDKCKEAGCYKMALSSNLKREGAHRFYESLGFARHGYSFLIELD